LNFSSLLKYQLLIVIVFTQNQIKLFIELSFS